MDGSSRATPWRLGRYVVYDTIGSGAMATVYFGRLEGPGGFRRTVAIKRLHPHIAKDPDFVAMFLDEARLVARIHHPNVVQTFDVVAQEGEVFVVMEYLHGESLARVFRSNTARHTPASVRIAAAIIGHALHGLHAAHTAKNDDGEPLGLVHRDVSPQNIVVGADGVSRVLDFGIAMARGRGYTTRDGKVKGTLGYMSPEQLRGEAVDRRADVYSTGVLLWELLTGEPLFLGDHEEATVGRVLEHNVPPPSARASGISPGLDTIVLRALSRAREERFGDARQMAAALEREVGLASTSEVAEWLDTAVGDELARRAQTLAAIESASSQEPAGATHNAPERPHRQRNKAFAVVAGALVVMAGAGALLGRRGQSQSPRHGSSVTAPTVSASTVSVFALPVPDRVDEKAKVAYREAMQAFHDGSITAVRRKLAMATELDPGLAQAHVRCVWFLDFDIATARAHAQAARRLRAILDERDVGLLDALDPGLRDPSDDGEVQRRLVALLERYPSDLEILYYLEATLEDNGQHQAALDVANKAFAIDPTFAMSLLFKAKAEEGLLDLSAARVTLQQCLDQSPSAASCMSRAAFLDIQAGDSLHLLAISKRMIEVEEQSWMAYGFLARALRAQGAPREAVAEALRKKWSLYPDPERSFAPRIERVDFDVSNGDFEHAEASARALEENMPAGADAWDRGELTRRLIGIYDETGRPNEAASAAERYRKVQSALPGPSGGSQIGLASLDAYPTILGELLRGGRISKESHAHDLDAWLARWTSSLSDDGRRYLWVPGFAAPAETRAEALEALRVLPGYSPLPPAPPDTPWLAAIARVYFLAGDFEQAAATTERAVAACIDLDFPIDHTRAAFYLGQIKEHFGDTAAACEAYTRVLERWGAARPRSLTADRARARKAALGCR